MQSSGVKCTPMIYGQPEGAERRDAAVLGLAQRAGNRAVRRGIAERAAGDAVGRKWHH